MHRLLRTCLLLSVPFTGYAQDPTRALSDCLAENTSGRDRKDLAKWVFLALGAHPENKQFFATDAAKAIDEANKTAAGIIMRLMTESCNAQMKNAIAQGGPRAIQAAFGNIGQLAMQELMSHPDVNAAMSAFEKYADREKLGNALNGK